MEKIEGQQPLCRERLDKEPRRVAWYPGSEKRADAFMKAVGGVEELGQDISNGDSTSAPSTYIPWLFKSGLTPEEVSTNFLLSVHTYCRNSLVAFRHKDVMHLHACLVQPDGEAWAQTADL